MNGIIEKVAGILLVAYVGTTEWRMRNKVGKDRFGDLIARLDRIESKIDKRNEKETRNV